MNQLLDDRGFAMAQAPCASSEHPLKEGSMQQWVQTVSVLIAQNRHAEMKGDELSSCTSFFVEGKRVYIRTITSHHNLVPIVVGFSQQSVNPRYRGLVGPKFAFVLRPGQTGVLIQTLKLKAVSGDAAEFERTGKEEWYLPV